MVLRYADLFCGLGAFHTSFKEDANFQCVLACDIDEGIRKIYAANYGVLPHDDVRTLKNINLPDFELLCAGFPCQPFSIAGNGEGFRDTEKGNLFYDILDILDIKHPPMCILENVKQLQSHDNGNTLRIIITSLEQRGYTVVFRCLNSAKFGSPQARERLFLFATQGHPFVFPEHTFPERPVSSLLEHETELGWKQSGYTLVSKPGKKRPYQPTILYDVLSKKTGKGGRQGERVYSVNSVGITVCASSGGPGAKTGLYETGTGIRRLNVREVCGMFGFPVTYTFTECTPEKSLFYLGNSIVVNVVSALRPSILDWFHKKRVNG